MNIDELEKLLFTLSPSEIKYQSETNPSWNVNKSVEAGKPFNGSYFIDSDIVYINKQSRFIDVSPHSHDFIEIVYIYSGTCYQNINGEDIVLTKGDICIIDTGIIHSIKAGHFNDIFINILMRKDYLTSSLLSRLSSDSVISQFLVNAITESTNHENYLIFNNKDTSKANFFMKSILCEYFDKGLCSTEVINCYLILLFSELIRTTEYSYHRKNSINDSQNNLIDILKYIEKNYNDCTLESVANQFNFHPNYLSSFIRKMTGKTYKEIVQTQRMLNASNYLKNSNLPIYEIAEKSGYNNLTFFYKKFKEFYGVFPQEYRNK